MSSSDRKGPGHRRRLHVEGLEGRELLSMGSYLMHAAAVTPASFSTLVATAAQANAESSATAEPVPTAQWLRRQQFAAKFVGSYVIGPPRFTNQAATISLDGSGGSNQSLHANLQMVYFTPADPATGAITGVAAMFPKNVATTGTTLALDLTGASQPTQHGLPTHFTWTVDSNSGGIYLAAGDFGTGQGTLDLKFMPATQANRGGKVVVTIRGLINGGGIFSTIQTPGNRANNP